MHIDWSKLPEVEGMRLGASRQAICGDHLSAVRVVTEPGTGFDGKTHWHNNDQILVMVSGRAQIVIDGTEHDVGPGEMLFFPSGSKHAAVGVGPDGCVYYEIFGPARPDQLPGWVGQSVLRFD